MFETFEKPTLVKMGNIFTNLCSCFANNSEIIDGLLENEETESNISDHIADLFQFLNDIDSSDEEEFPYNPFGFEEELPSYPSEDEEELPSYTSEDDVNFPLNPFGDEEPAIEVEEEFPTFPIKVEEEFPFHHSWQTTLFLTAAGCPRNGFYTHTPQKKIWTGKKLSKCYQYADY